MTCRSEMSWQGRLFLKSVRPLRNGLIGRPTERLFTGSALKNSDDSREIVSNTRVRGIDVLRNPLTNKGVAFTLEERQTMGIHGLLPPCFFTADEQENRILKNFERFDNDLDKFSYLMALRDRNEKLFYRVLTNHIAEMMPIIYTPTVGLACQKYGLIYTQPRGVYITTNDLGHVHEILCNWPIKEIRAVIVTDGERILGLGDLGAYGMGIPVGKLALYTAIGGLEPRKCLPVCIDAGTNNEELLDDVLYIGIREKRDRSQKYFDLVDEFMEAVVKRYGQDTLVQFEDFANMNAFRFLNKYHDKYLMFNDDIQGTAAVVVAGGAGQAATGIADLLVTAMEREGISREEAAGKIWMVDIDGLLVKDRPVKYGLSEEQEHLSRSLQPYVKNSAPMNNLEEIVRFVRPSCIFGASTVKGAFTEPILRYLGKINERPLIMALSNPTAKAECTAEEAYRFTDGRAIFASGSPFQPVNVAGRTFYPGQGNNAYIFPAMALSSVLFKVKHIPTHDAFLEAALCLAGLVRQSDLEKGLVYPPLDEVREVSIKMAAHLGDYFYKKELALKYPKPDDMESFVRGCVWTPEYETFIPSTYSWPEPSIPRRGTLR